MPLFLYPPYSSEVTATGNISTSATADVLASGMSITPGAGTYLVWFSADVEISRNGETVNLSIYANGSLAGNSRRPVYFSDKDKRSSASTHVKVTVDAGQSIEGRWFVSTSTPASTGTMGNRSLMIEEVYDA